MSQKNSNVLLHSVLAIVGAALVWQILLVQALRLLHGEVTAVHTITVMTLGSIITGMMFLTVVSTMRGTIDRGQTRDEAITEAKDQDVSTREQSCVVTLMRDVWQLSEAETEVALFAVKGFSNREIADLRGSEIATVKKQLSAVYRKSELENRFQLMAFVNDELVQASHLDSEANVRYLVPALEGVSTDPKARDQLFA